MIDPSKVGELIKACSIDLPNNDIVEAIEFERFFMLTLRFQEFQRPATMLSSFGSQAIGTTDLASLFGGGAPLSSRRADWERHTMRSKKGAPGIQRISTQSD